MMKNKFIHSTNILSYWIVAIFLLTGCASPSSSEAHSDPEQSRKITAVATTTIIGDIVKQVGGEALELTVLLPPGADPHGYEFAPQDITRVARAQILFFNGGGLEGFLDNLVQNTPPGARLVDLSQGIDLLTASQGRSHLEQPVDEPGDEHEEEHLDEHLEEQPDDQHDHIAGDPHYWTDPNNVAIWTTNIAASLSALDPQNASFYQANAAAYTEALKSLDQWIQEQVSAIPANERKLVTDHQLFTYFTHRYGFEQVGAVIPAYSSLAEPSAKELAELETAIREAGVKAIFVGHSVNPRLASRVSQDTGVQLVYIYTGSLSDKDGPAPDYLSYIRYNVSAIVDALK